MAEPTTDLNAEFAALVVSHRDRARSTAWRLCGGDAALAEDVVQEAFLAAHQALPRFRGDARLSTWFYRILVRTAHRLRQRRALRERVVGLFSRERTAGASPPERDGPLQRRIAAALDQLSAGQREAFVLVHLEGFTVVEAAEVLGVAPGTVKSHLHRALVRLRVELADLHPSAPLALRGAPHAAANAPLAKGGPP